MLIKNSRGRIVQVSPERADEMIQKGEGFIIEEKPADLPANPLECPYCGMVCKNQLGFNKHTNSCKKKPR